jgi:hypothetical protein
MANSLPDKCMYIIGAIPLGSLAEHQPLIILLRKIKYLDILLQNIILASL